MTVESLVVAAAVPGWVAWRVWERRRRRAHLQRILERPDEPAVRLADDLSPALRDLAARARTLRLLLETPLRRGGEFPLLHDSPWGRRERCEAYDIALGDARRFLWEWIVEVARLGDDDHLFLAERGLSLAPFRRLVFGGADRSRQPWDDHLWAPEPDLDDVGQRVERTIVELRRFERALAAAPTDPYRRG